MKHISKATIARNERIQQVISSIDANLGADHANALGKFAECYGANWAQELLDQWYSGRDANFAYYDENGKRIAQGHLLRQIRNHPDHGPAFYRAFNGE